MRKKRFVLWGSLLIMALLVAGCGSVQDKVGEKVAEGIIEKATGSEVDINSDGVKVEADGATLESGSAVKWPQESMGNLPEPKGKVNMVINGTSGSKVCQVYLTEVKSEDAKDYIEKVKSLGYAQQMLMTDENGISFTGKNSSEVSVMVMCTSNSQDMTLTYAPMTPTATE